MAREKIWKVAGHTVPELLFADEGLRAIEMTVVRPPFLLDFASAYLVGEAPDFSEEIWEEWRGRMGEQFGKRWGEVEAVLAEFERLTGMVLLDVNPGNIRFADNGGL